MNYNSIGNIRLNTKVAATNYVYGDPAHPQAVTAAGSNTYQYDANGNMIAKNDFRLHYDYDNRLIRISTSSGATLAEFLYDYTGARVKKWTSASSTVYVGKLYECSAGECASNSGTKHIFAGSRRAASKQGAEITYYHPDHLGGLNVATDIDGHLIETDTYYPFGENHEGPENSGVKYKFTGQEKDFETAVGLYYYGARYYDPVIGRFISPDTIVQAPGDPQTLNRYSYCRNNPLIYTDPTGHIFGIDDFIFGMIVGILLNVTTSAIMGGDLTSAAAMGALSGGMFSFAGTISGPLAKTLCTTVQVAKVATHSAVGMATGAISAVANHGDVLRGALTGGLSAGVASYLGGYIPSVGGKYGDFGIKLAGHSAIGSLTGGISSVVMGGSFGEGAAQGAWTSAYGFIFNEAMHSLQDDDSMTEFRQDSSGSAQNNSFLSGAYNFIGQYLCGVRWSIEYLKCNEGPIVTKNCYARAEFKYRNCIKEVERKHNVNTK